MNQPTFLKNKSFHIGHSSFQVSKLNWTPLPFEPKKHSNIPCKRYLHCALAFQGRLYVLGGTDNDSSIKQSRMYSLDLTTLKWTTIQGRTFTQNRTGQASALFCSQLYFFGGSQTRPTNDFFKFNPHQNSWTLIQTEDITIPQRQSPIMVPINNQYLFLYGGIDTIEDRIYSDAFIYRQQRWSRLQVHKPLSQRIKMGVAVCGGRIFLFGGEGPSQNQPLYLNTLHEAIINEFEPVVTFNQIFYKGKIPSKRTSHGMVGISPNYFMLYGGESISQGKSQILGDIWIFDVHELYWIEIDTIYGPMIPRYQFTLTPYNNELYVFGGFSQFHSVIDDLVKMQFLQESNKFIQFCQNCQKEEENSNITKQMAGKEIQISTGFLYNLSLQIAFPFKAVQLVIDAAQMLSSQSIRLSCFRSVQQFDCFLFQFQNSQSISTQYFLNMSQTAQSPYESQIIHSIKIGCLRLGKTVLYICATDKQRKVFLISVDNKFAPGFQDHYIHYSYVENLITGCIYPTDGQYNKRIIYNILKTQLQDPYTALSARSGHSIYIFQVNVLPTAQKAYYYELIFYNSVESDVSDVRVYHNQKRNQLLTQLGHDPFQLPDFSLRKYLQYSRLNRNIKILLNTDIQPIPITTYHDHLKKLKASGSITQLFTKLTHKSVVKTAIFQCKQGQFIKQNMGILIYCGNILINRYDCNLGEIISDKFYKKKYRRNENIFKYLGIVMINESLNLNKAKTCLKKRIIYRQIIEQLTKKLKNIDKTSIQLQTQLSQLYEGHFSIAKQPTKKIKKQMS